MSMCFVSFVLGKPRICILCLGKITGSSVRPSVIACEYIFGCQVLLASRATAATSFRTKSVASTSGASWQKQTCPNHLKPTRVSVLYLELYKMLMTTFFSKPDLYRSIRSCLALSSGMYPLRRHHGHHLAVHSIVAVCMYS